MKKLKNYIKSTKNINDLKIILANEATSILHGKGASKKAERIAEETFKEKKLSQDLPEIKINANELERGIEFLNFLAKNKIVSSKSEARRIIANNGFKVNDTLIENNMKNLDKNHFKNKICKISLGKKKHYIVKIT